MNLTTGARSRCRRVVVGVLVAVAVTGCGPEATQGSRPSLPSPGSTTTSAPSCPPGLILARVFPPARSEVRLRIVNGSGRAGVETTIAAEFRDRGLQVVGTDQQSQSYDGLVILRYGPQAVGAAWDVQPFFRIGLDASAESWQNDFQLARTDDVVDVVLGNSFAQLATVTEVNQATAKLGLPTPPPGTCASPHS